MKRYLLFAWDQYYPSGGWNDFIGCFDSFEEAQQFLSNINCDEWQIIDNGTISQQGHKGDNGV